MKKVPLFFCFLFALALLLYYQNYWQKQSLAIFEDKWQKANNFFLARKYESAKECYQEILSFSQSNKKAQILYRIGYCYHQLKNYPQALAHLQQSLAIAPPSSPIFFNCLQKIGDIYWEQKQVPLAIQTFTKIIKQAPQEKIKAQTLTRLAKIYQDLSNLAQALDYWKKALEIHTQLKRDSDIAKIQHQIGSLHTLQQNHSQAVHAHNKSLQIYQELGLREKVARQHQLMGEANLKLQDYPRAQRNFQAAHQIFEEQLLEQEMANSLQCLAQVHQINQRYQKAIQTLEKAGKIFRKFDQQESLMQNLRSRAQLHRLLGENRKTQGYLQQALDIQKSLIEQAQQEIPQVPLGTSLNISSESHAWKLYQYLQDKLNMAVHLNELADLYEKQEKYTIALHSYKEAIKIYQKAQEKLSIATTQAKIASVYEKIQRPQKAIEVYNQAIKIYQEEKQNNAVIHILHKIAQVHQNQNNYEKAILVYQTIVQNTSILSPQTLALEHHNIGQAYHAWGKHAQAISHYQKSLQILKGQNDLSSMGIVLRKIGQSHFAAGNPIFAQKVYQEALQAYKKGNFETQLAQTYQEISSLYQRTGNSKAAISSLEKAIGIFEKLGQLPQALEVLQTLAQVCQQSLLHERAHFLFSQVQQKAQELSLSLLEARALEGTAQVHLSQNHLIDAQDFFEKSLKKYQALSHKEGLARVSVELGKILQASGKNEKAEELFQKGLSHNQGSSSPLEQMVNLHRLGLAQYKQNNYEKAIEHLQLSQKIIQRIKPWANPAQKNSLTLFEIENLRNRASSFIRLGENKKAYHSICQIQSLYQKKPYSKIPVLQIQEQIPSHTALVIYANTDREFTIQMIIHSDGIQVQEVSQVAPLRAIFSKYQRNINSWLKRNQHTIPQEGSFTNYLQKSLHYYRYLLQTPDLITQEKELYREFQDISHLLYRAFIEPIAPALKNKKQLIIIPEGELFLIPFATLINTSGQYFGQNHSLRYLTSVQRMLASKSPAQKNLLIVTDKPQELEKPFSVISPRQITSTQEIPSASFRNTLWLSPLEQLPLQLKSQTITLSKILNTQRLPLGRDLYQSIHNIHHKGGYGVSFALWDNPRKFSLPFLRQVYLLMQKKRIAYPIALGEIQKQMREGKWGEKWQSPFYWACYTYYGR